MSDDRIMYYFVIKQNDETIFKGWLRCDEAWEITLESSPCSCYIYRTEKDYPCLK